MEHHWSTFVTAVLVALCAGVAGQAWSDAEYLWDRGDGAQSSVAERAPFFPGLSPQLQCPVGWWLLLGQCEDVDECRDPNSRPCPGLNTVCRNTPGSYRCQCLSRHTGDPYSFAGCLSDEEICSQFTTTTSTTTDTTVTTSATTSVTTTTGITTTDTTTTDTTTTDTTTTDTTTTDTTTTDTTTTDTTTTDTTTTDTTTTDTTTTDTTTTDTTTTDTTTTDTTTTDTTTTDTTTTDTTTTDTTTTDTTTTDTTTTDTTTTDTTTTATTTTATTTTATTTTATTTTATTTTATTTTETTTTATTTTATTTPTTPTPTTPTSTTPTPGPDPTAPIGPSTQTFAGSSTDAFTFDFNITTAAPEIEIPGGYSRCLLNSVDSGSLFRLHFDSTQTWDEARAICRADHPDADLAKVAHSSVNDCLQTWFLYHTSVYYSWIGLRWDPDSGKFLWTDGTPAEGVYENWRSDQPANEEQRPCVRLYSFTGLWETAECSNLHAFFCQITV